MDTEPYMYYILYVSQAYQKMSDVELTELLEKSRSNNVRDGITGLLIYKQWREDERANFLQLLEGPREAVEAAYNKITQDSRHHTIIGLERGEIAERNFSDWAMGFKNLQTGELSKFPGFRDIDEKSFDPNNFASKVMPAMEAMKLFYQND